MVKATSGVTLDNVEDTVNCNACGAGWSIVAIPMVGNIVQVKLRLTSSPVPVVLCVGCARPAHPVGYIGYLPYCNDPKHNNVCYAAERALVSGFDRCIVCGSDGKWGNTRVMDCITKGARGVISVCAKHVAACEALGPTRTIEQVDQLKASNPHAVYKPRGGIRFGANSSHNGGRRRR